MATQIFNLLRKAKHFEVLNDVRIETESHVNSLGRLLQNILPSSFGPFLFSKSIGEVIGVRVSLVNHVSFLENFARKFRQSEIHGLMCSLILCQSFEILFNIFICLSIPPCPFIIEVDQDAKLRSTFIQDVLIFLLLLHSLLHRSSHV